MGDRVGTVEPLHLETNVPSAKFVQVVRLRDFPHFPSGILPSERMNEHRRVSTWPNAQFL